MIPASADLGVSQGHKPTRVHAWCTADTLGHRLLTANTEGNGLPEHPQFLESALDDSACLRLFEYTFDRFHGVLDWISVFLALVLHDLIASIAVARTSAFVCVCRAALLQPPPVTVGGLELSPS